MNITVYQDAALYAECLTQLQGVPSEQATECARNLGGQTLDRREIQRWRQRVRAMKPKLKTKNEDLEKRLREQYKAMLQEQYNAIVRKYRLE